MPCLLHPALAVAAVIPYSLAVLPIKPRLDESAIDYLEWIYSFFSQRYVPEVHQYRFLLLLPVIMLYSQGKCIPLLFMYHLGRQLASE